MKACTMRRHCPTQMSIQVVLSNKSIHYSQPAMVRSFTETRLTSWILTSERCKRSASESLVHADDRCVDTESSSSQGGKEVNDIKRVEQELLAVTTHPSLDSAVDTIGYLSSNRIKKLFR